MSNDIQIGVRIDNTGAIKSIDLLDNSIVDLTDSTESLNKELVDTQKEVKKAGKDGETAFGKFGQTATKAFGVVKTGVGYIEKLSTTTQGVFSSISETFSKMAVTSGLMGNNVMAGISSFVSLGTAIMAVGLKIKLIYTAFVLLGQILKPIVHTVRVILMTMVSVIQKIQEKIGLAMGKISSYVKNLSSNPYIGEFARKINVTLVGVQQNISIFRLSLIRATSEISLAFAKLERAIAQFGGASKAQLADIDKNITNHQRLVTRSTEIIRQKIAQKPIGKSGIQTVFENITQSSKKMLGGVGKDLSDIGMVFKISASKMASTSKNFLTDLWGVDTKLLSLASTIMNIQGKTAPMFGKAIAFIAKNFKLLAGVAVSVAAAVAYSFKAFDLAKQADQLDDFASRLGMSKQSVQTWDTILKLAGTSMEAFTPAIDAMTRKAVDSSETFTRLGVSVKDSSGAYKDTETLFNETIVALAGIENQTERSKMAMEIFGKQGGRLNSILAQGKDGVIAMTGAYSAYNVISDKTAEKSAKLNDRIFLMGKKIEKVRAEFLTPFISLFDRFTQVIQKANFQQFIAGPMLALAGSAYAVLWVFMKLVNVFSIFSNVIRLSAEGINLLFASMMNVVKLLPFVSKETKAFIDSYNEESIAGAEEALKNLGDATKQLFGIYEEGADLRGGKEGITDLLAVPTDKDTKAVTDYKQQLRDMLLEIKKTNLQLTFEGQRQLIDMETRERLKIAILGGATKEQVDVILAERKRLKEEVDAEEQEQTASLLAELADRETAMRDNARSWTDWQIGNMKDGLDKELAQLRQAQIAKLSEQDKAFEDEIIGAEELADRKAEIVADGLAKEEELRKNARKAESEATRARFNAEFSKWSDYGNRTLDAIKGYADVQRANQEKSVGTWYDNEKAKLDGTLMTARKRTKAEAELEKQKSDKMREIKKKEQTWAIAQALIDGASAIVSIWSSAGSLGPIAGPIVAGLESVAIGGITAANIATIKAQQYARNSGIIGGANGSTEGPDTVTVGARPGEMFLNGRDQKTLFNSIKGNKLGGGGSNTFSMPITINGNADEKAIDKIKSVQSDFARKIIDIVNDGVYRRQISFAR